MKTIDDRTPAQTLTHRTAVVARDSFLSGWGGATGGASRCAWACETLTDARRLFAWVKSRPEMKFARIVHLPKYRAPRGTAHFHIYTVTPSHPALSD